MTPPETNDPAVLAAFEQLETHETANRRSTRWLIVALTTALGGAGGTGAKAWIDASNVDQLREVVATHVVEANTRNTQAEKERERLIEQVAALRETVAGLKATVEIMASPRRAHREAIDGVAVPPPIEKTTKAQPKPDKAAIQATKQILFE